MDDSIRQALLRDAVPYLAGLFGLQAAALSPIQTHRNLVFRGNHPSGRSVVFKAVPCVSGGSSYVLGELDWMAFLHEQGVPVPGPNASINGNLVETLTMGPVALSACCLDYVAGTIWRDRPADPADVTAIGALAGRMASTCYRSSSPRARRPPWHDAAWFRDPEVAIHRSMPKVVARVKSLHCELESLPHEAFGLVHDDLHSGNVIFASGTARPTPIDFESSHYTWHIAEVASALYFHLWKTRQSVPEELTRRARQFTACFMEGYRHEHALASSWMRLIPTFLKVRELSIFASCGLHDKDFDTIGSQNDGFVFMKENIEQAVPYVDLDFVEFA